MQNQFISHLLILILAATLSACGGSGGDKSTDPPLRQNPPPLTAGQAATTEGTIQGSVEGDLVVFRGVRYAAPPLDDLRFKAPQPPAAFAGVRDALGFGANCTQPAGAVTTGEEDCLFLNVWSHNDDVVRPVMVYLHPGSANGVGGDMASIDPTEFAAATDVVVVNMNRRIGVLGNLAIDELIQENLRLTAGNYGLLDVIAALEWVRDNIAVFNGDPDRVMIFGTSSGGQLACLLLATPEVSGLIDAISIQSAPCGGNLQVLTDTAPFQSRHPPAVITHRHLLTAVGCDVAADILACMRAISVEDLVIAGVAQEIAAGRPLFSPLVDGIVVQASPRVGAENQLAGDIPLITGMAENEVGNRFENLSLPDDAAYRAHYEAVFSDPIDDILYSLYPSADYANPKEAWITMFGDFIFSCSAAELARAAMSGAPSFLYEITRGFDSGTFAGQGAFHAIDSAYLFGTFDVFGYTPDFNAGFVSDVMRGAWSSFAEDPTTAPIIAPGSGFAWPVFNPASSTYVDFNNPMTAGPGHRDGRCAALRAALP